MSQEIELKLSIPRKALAALRRHSLFAGAVKQGNAATLTNTYYDTPELALKARKVGLRTRRHRNTWLQTVKCAAESAGGLSQRPEWEQLFSGSFDFSGVDAPKVRRLLERHAAGIEPVFTTRFRRETRLYAPSDEVSILMMLDTGEVLAGERREPICELELELVQGRPLDLLNLAAALAADLPLLPEDTSKAQRGYRLHLGEAPAPLRASVSRITAAQTPLEAFRTLAFDCLRQWQANAAGAATGEDPEFIHQLRVALRRLRSLLQLFFPALPAPFVEEWDERLRACADGVGEARDLDVLCDEILAPVDAVGTAQAAGVAALAERAGRERETARRAALQSVAGPIQGRTLLDFTTDLYALAEEPAAENLTAFARRQLDRLQKKARRRYQAAVVSHPGTLHALRIALKRARYALEFLAPLLPRKAGERHLERVVHAQGALGFLNDVDVGCMRLAAWADDAPELREATAFVRGWHGKRYLRLSRRALRELGPLLERDSPWNR